MNKPFIHRYILPIVSIFFISLFFSCTRHISSGPDFGKLSFITQGNQAFVATFPMVEEVNIPAETTVNGNVYPVTGIANTVDSQKVKTLRLPSSIKYIEPGSFANSNVENLFIDDLESWCAIDFQNIITEDNNLSTEGNSNPINAKTKIYVNNIALGDTLNIPENVNYISANAFKELNFSNLYIGKNVKQISENAFSGCKNLKEITGGENLEEISNSAFKDSNIEKVSLNSPLKRIGNFAFPESLRYIHIPASVEEIGMQAFPNVEIIDIDSFESWVKINYIISTDTNNSELASIEGLQPYKCPHNFSIGGEIIKKPILPETIDKINDYAFYYAGFTGIELPKTLTAIGDKAFDYCPNIEWLTIPGSVKNISTFNNCKKLGAILLEEGVENVDNAFCECPSIYWLRIPSTLKLIDFNLFNSPSAINVLCSATNPPLIKQQKPGSSFSPSHFLYVPKKNIKNYSVAEGWSIFKIIEPLENAI